MIPLDTIPCRWREETKYKNIFKCSSCKVDSDTVTSEVCSFCQVRDHEPVEPSLMQKIKNFAKAVTQHASTGFEKSSPEEIRRRLTICEEPCSQFTKSRSCGLCGCNMDAKASWKDQNCPMCIRCHKHKSECKCVFFKSKWDQDSDSDYVI